MTCKHLPIVVTVGDCGRSSEVSDEALEIGGEKPRFFLVLNSVLHTASEVQCVIATRVRFHMEGKVFELQRRGVLVDLVLSGCTSPHVLRVSPVRCTETVDVEVVFRSRHSNVVFQMQTEFPFVVAGASHGVLDHDHGGIRWKILIQRLVSELVDHSSEMASFRAVRHETVDNIDGFEPVREVGQDLGGGQIAVWEGEVPAWAVVAESVVLSNGRHVD